MVAQAAPVDTLPTAGEPHAGSVVSRLNWLRAGVLGANDGIVSVAALVIGIAGATPETAPIVTGGIAGLAAGALSMAAGEYVSVSTQRDTEKALIAQEIRELAEDPDGELAELAGLYEAKGLSPRLARQVAEELHAHDALAAHAETELGISHDEFTDPWQAAGASGLAFVVGALIPVLAMVLCPPAVRVWATVAAVVVALAATGVASATLGRAARGPAALRNVLGGAAAMAITYGIGVLVGHQL